MASATQLGTVQAMTVLLPGPRIRRRRLRGATMLEFALILPIFVFMLVFVIDMGHLILMSGAMQDATFSAARTGAQIGGAGIDASSSGSLVCHNGGTCTAGTTWHSMKDGAAQIPGSGKLGNLVDMSILHGAQCQQGTAEDHVVIKTRYSTQLVTPGLGALLKMFGGPNATAADGNWTLAATAVARCEVIRS